MLDILGMCRSLIIEMEAVAGEAYLLQTNADLGPALCDLDRRAPCLGPVGGSHGIGPEYVLTVGDQQLLVLLFVM